MPSSASPSSVAKVPSRSTMTVSRAGRRGVRAVGTPIPPPRHCSTPSSPASSCDCRRSASSLAPTSRQSPNTSHGPRPSDWVDRNRADLEPKSGRVRNVPRPKGLAMRDSCIGIIRRRLVTANSTFCGHSCTSVVCTWPQVNVKRCAVIGPSATRLPACRRRSSASRFPHTLGCRCIKPFGRIRVSNALFGS